MRKVLLTVLAVLLAFGLQSVAVAQQPRLSDLLREKLQLLPRRELATQSANPLYYNNAEQPWLAAGPNVVNNPSSDLWATTIQYHNTSSQPVACGFHIADDNGMWTYSVSAIDDQLGQVVVGDNAYIVYPGQTKTVILTSLGGGPLLGQVQQGCAVSDPTVFSLVTGTYAFTLYAASGAVKTESSYQLSFTAPTTDSDFVIPRYSSWDIACHTGPRPAIVGTGSATNNDVCGIGVALTCSQAQCPNPVQISFTPLDKMGNALGTPYIATQNAPLYSTTLGQTKGYVLTPDLFGGSFLGSADSILVQSLGTATDGGPNSIYALGFQETTSTGTGDGATTSAAAVSTPIN